MTHCSDNLRYGVNFAKRFIDGPDKKGLKKTGELRNLMNLHNNKAGRMVRIYCVNCKISCENSFWAYKMIAFPFWILFVFNLILFLFDKYSWLWSNQLPDAVHIHDICLQFHDFIKIELYVQKFKFRHSIVPTNLVHSSMRTCWEPIWLFPHVDIKSYFKSKK